MGIISKCFHDYIEYEYKQSIRMCYGYYNSMHMPLLTSSQCNYFATYFEHTFPCAFHGLASMLNIEVKGKSNRSKHLLPYYKQQILWNFLSLMNTRNNHLFV